MKKLTIFSALFAFLFVMTSLPAAANQKGNRISDKFDISGSFTSNANHVWDGTNAGDMWDYEIHVKVAEDKTKSKGVVKFSTEGVDLVGHVEDVKYNYEYLDWNNPGENLAIVGWTNYEGTKYNFMF